LEECYEKDVGGMWIYGSIGDGNGWLRKVSTICGLSTTAIATAIVCGLSTTTTAGNSNDHHGSSSVQG